MEMERGGGSTTTNGRLDYDHFSLCFCRRMLSFFTLLSFKLHKDYYLLLTSSISPCSFLFYVFFPSLSENSSFLLIPVHVTSKRKKDYLIFLISVFFSFISGGRG